jgi:hypothetical protein
MTSMTSAETIEAKTAFKRFAQENGIQITHYHADNGRFADNAFKQHTAIHAIKRLPIVVLTPTSKMVWLSGQFGTSPNTQERCFSTPKLGGQAQFICAYGHMH